MTVIVPAEHLPDWLGGPVDGVSAASGLPSDQIRLLLCLLSAVPLGWIHRLIPSATVKHLLSTLIGAFFCWFVVGNSAYCVPVSALLVYIIVQVVPRTSAPTVVFVSSVAWLSGWHIYRLYVDYMGWSLDATMILMIWTVKACTFAYNVADGQALNEGLKLSERESTHVFRSERALTQLPSLLEYFSYVFFFGGVLVGPCFEAKEYFDFIDGSILKKHKIKSIPNTILPALKCVATGLLMYVGIAIAGSYPMLNYVNTEAFGNLGLLAKFAYFWISITSSRFKYYFAWCLGEAGCVAAGFGLNGFVRDANGVETTTPLWNRVSNCNMIAVEFAPRMTDITNNWNMGVNNWLKNYVYFRVEAPSFVRKFMPQKSFINLVTKATSAFWHGFYPSYYLFFFGAWLAGEMDEALRASFEPLNTAEKKKARAGHWWKGPTNLYELVSAALNLTVLNFWGVCFVLLRADFAWEFTKNMYYMGIILPIVVTILCRTVFRRKRAPKAVATASTSSTTPSASPEAKTVSAAVISTASPDPEPPVHDNIAAKPRRRSIATPVVAAATVEDDAEGETPADRVKSRARRSRSNKAE